jgi:hypothetical protein
VYSYPSLRALRELVPFPRGAFSLGSTGISIRSISMPNGNYRAGRYRKKSITPNFFTPTASSRYSTIWHMFGAAAGHSAETDDQAFQSDYLKHDFYHLISRPAQTHHCFRVRLEKTASHIISRHKGIPWEYLFQRQNIRPLRLGNRHDGQPVAAANERQTVEFRPVF